MFEILLAVCVGSLFTMFAVKYLQKPAGKEGKYDRMTQEAFYHLYREYHAEMQFWASVLNADIEYVTITGHQHRGGRDEKAFTHKGTITQLKKIAVWRMDAIEDILEEMSLAQKVSTEVAWPEPYIGDFRPLDPTQPKASAQ